MYIHFRYSLLFRAQQQQQQLETDKNKVGGLGFVFRCCWDDVNHARPHLSVSALINQLWHSLRSPAACTQLHIAPTNGKNKDESLDETERSRKWIHKKHDRTRSRATAAAHCGISRPEMKRSPPPSTHPSHTRIYTCKFFRYVFTRGFPFQMSLFKQPKFFPFVFHTFLEEGKKTKVCGPGLGRAADDDTAAAAPSVTHFHDSPTRAKGIEAYRLLGEGFSRAQSESILPFLFLFKTLKIMLHSSHYLCPVSLFSFLTETDKTGEFRMRRFQKPRPSLFLDGQASHRENVQDKIGLPVWTGAIDNDVLLLNLIQLD